MLPPAAPAFADFQGLERLRSAAQREDPAALEEASVQFEALVLGMMLKAARDASLGEGILDGSETRQYLELMDQQVALELARQGGLGFGDLIVEGLDSTPPDDAFAFRPDTPAQFVEALMPLAQAAGRELGVDPRLLVSQAALETGWGRSVLQHPNGRSAFNLFGIKADSGWRGARVARPTLEYSGGVAERRWAQFRAYSDAAESFRDYTGLIKGSPRYRQALSRSGDPEAYAHGLAEAGYATDPGYAQKWLAIFHGDTLAETLQHLKSESFGSTH